MEIRIKMTEIESGDSKIMFENVSAENASKIVKRFNELNAEAAKLTGKAIRFMLSISVKY